MKISFLKGFSFGLTSGVIKTLGIMVGLNAYTNSKLVVIGGILTKEIKSKKCFNDVKSTSDLSIVLSLNCGIKIINGDTIETQEKESVLAFFLLKFIEKLRSLGSVPALDADKYLKIIR